MRAFVTRHERLAVGLVLLLGLLIRLPAVPVDFRGVVDVQLFMDWGRTARDAGFQAVSRDIADKYGLYPPFSLWILAALASVESLVPLALRGGDTLLISLVKSLPVVADLALAALVACLVRPRGPRAAVAAAAAIALNPAFIYIGAAWGQIDSLYAVLLVAATALLVRGSVPGAWVSWTLASLVKVQGLLLAPLVLVASLRDAGWHRTLVGIVVALVVTVLLFVPWFGGGLGHYLETIYRVYPRTTINALNLWYAVGSGQVSSDVRRVAPFVTPRAIGFVLLGLVTAAVSVAVWFRRDRIGLALPAAVLSMAPFTVMTGMRGRYLLAVLPFLVLLAFGWDRRGVLRGAGWVALAVTVTLSINLLVILPPDPSLWVRFSSGKPGGPLQPLVEALALAASVGNVVIFAWLLINLWVAARRTITPDTISV